MRLDRLRAARRAAGHTQESLAEALGYDRTTVGTWEQGKAVPQRDIRSALAQEIGVSLAELNDMVGAPGTGEQMPHWLSAYLGMEQSATFIEAYQTRVVHSLLQTTDYARAVASRGLEEKGEAELAQIAAQRVQRQERLRRPGDRLPLTIVQFEGSLRLKVGDVQTMADQLAYIRELATMSNITVRVLTFDAGMHEGLRGPFTLLTTPWNNTPAVNIEGYGSSRFAEESHEVHYYLAVWKQVQGLALPPDESARFIERIHKEWESKL